MSDQISDQAKLAGFETFRHIEQVRNLLSDCATDLLNRAKLHDQSKLVPPEAEGFAEFTAKLAGTTYGSDEYKGFLMQMKPFLDHHYANNRHHPEFFRWYCPVCNLRIGVEDHQAAPQGPNESGVRYCPRCCSNGMLYESELIDDPTGGINGMTLLDLIEMFCDWKAATQRHNDGNLLRSIDINSKRFGIDAQLRRIFENTSAAFKEPTQ